MTVFSNQEVESVECDQQDIYDAIRALVRDRLGNGQRAAEISFALTYVAVELGLVVATDRADVYPIVMTAIAEAAKHDTARRESEGGAQGEACVLDDGFEVPANASVH